MLNNLTIVIPSRSRPKSLEKLVSYIYNWNAKIFILDGSDNINLDIEKISKKSSNLKYFHNTDGFYSRMKLINKLIKTKYTMLMGDDEFFVKKSVEKCIQFLEKNSDYVCCSGVAIGFNKSKQNKIMYKEVYPNLIGYRIFDKDPKSRVVNHFSNYVPSCIYGVSRSEILKKFIKEIKYLNCSCAEISEIWYQSTTVFMGKIIVLPELYWYRSMQNSPVKEKNWNRSIKFYEWYNNKKYNLEKKKIIQNFCKLNNVHSSKFFELALLNYSKSLKIKGHGSFNKKIYNLFKIIKVKFLKFFDKHSSTYFDKKYLKKFLRNKNISFNIKGINDIEKKITQK